MFGDDFPAAAKIDEARFAPVADDDLAVGPLERGTGNDARLLLGPLAVDPAGHGFEPGPAVGIVQRDSGVHLGDIRFGVECVALLERPAKARCQLLSDRCLSRAGHAHNDQDRWAAPMGACAIEAMDARRIGDEYRIGAADEETAFDDADHAADSFLETR